MAQDSNISSVPFFPSSTADAAASSKAQSNSKNAKGKQTSNKGEYEAVLSQALGNNKQTVKIDKPKVGNREPFFPKAAMPYHPDPRAKVSLAQTPDSHALNQILSEEDDVGSSEMFAPMSESNADQGDRTDLIQEKSNGYSEASVGKSQSNVGRPVNAESVMSKSYDGMAVSYPVRQIAEESLDESTVADLQAQGVWAMPMMVMAQPTPQFVQMMEATNQGAMGSGNAVQSPKEVAQFMASLENELGVTPDRLVEAFQKLPPGQLQLSPEKTMVQVVKNLELSPQDESKALDLYAKMLAKLEMQDQKQNNMLAAPVVNPEVLASKSQGQAAAQYAQWSEAPKAQGADVVSLKDYSKSAKSVESVNANAHTQSKGEAISGLSKLEGQGAQQQGSEQGLNQNQGQSNLLNQNAVIQKQVQATPDDGKLVKTDFKTELKSTDSLKSKDVVSSQVSNAHLANHVQNPQAQVQDLSAMVGAAGGAKVANGQEKLEAMQSIVNNAQLLAHKGGGEMSMTLKPDHMGEIQLKVAMEGNRVNVQMSTESNDVKRLIEQNVHELKSGLASHNLNMDKIQVSVSDRPASGFQNQSNGQPDFGSAKDFASQFNHNQGNGSRREQLMDLSALREVAKPWNSKPALGSLSASRQGSGRLNVVA